MQHPRRTRSLVGRLVVMLVVASFALLSFGPKASANRGLLYGPEDAVRFGPPDANGLVGYCVPWSLLAAAHIGFGGTVVESYASTHRFYLDLTQGMRCGRSLNGDPGISGYVFIPQVGFTVEGGELDTTGTMPVTHLGRLGVGIGVGTSRAAITYAPRLVFGNRNGLHATGVRHGLIASFGSDLFTVEVSHQMLAFDGRIEHDIRVGMSLNWLILAFLAAH